MTVHNHGIDPSCKERLVGECLLKPDAIVLDLHPGEAKELADWLIGTDMHLSIGDRIQIARQISKQIAPPRIPEPGKYGVVEAKYGDDIHTHEWVSDGKHWTNLDTGTVANWANLIAPVEIRKGI